MLPWVESITLIFFSIEVTLRIWVESLINPKFAGWKGRIKYCLTFNGYIDVISTYPFYHEWLIPFPIIWMKSFRMSRKTGKIAPYHSFELIGCDLEENQEECINDLRTLADRPGAWNITMLAFMTDKEEGHDHSGEDAPEDDIQLISRHFLHPRGHANFEASSHALDRRQNPILPQENFHAYLATHQGCYQHSCQPLEWRKENS